MNSFHSVCFHCGLVTTCGVLLYHRSNKNRVIITKNLQAKMIIIRVKPVLKLQVTAEQSA